MKKNVWIVIALVVAVFSFSSCGTQQSATQPTSKPVTTDTVVSVEPIKDVISIAEALDMFQNPDKTAAITKKYGYKLKTNYEVIDSISSLRCIIRIVL